MEGKVAAVVELLIFIVLLAYCLKILRSKRGPNEIILSIICFCSALFVSFDLFVSGESVFKDCMIDLAVAIEVILFRPFSEGKNRASLRFAICAYIVNAVLKLLYFEGLMPEWLDKVIAFTIVNFILSFSYVAMLLMLRFRSFRIFLKERTLKYNVREYMWFCDIISFMLMIILGFCCIHVVGRLQGILTLAAFVMYSGFFVLLFLRAVTGNVFLLAKPLEEMMDKVTVDERHLTFVEEDDESKKMATLYKRVVNFMVEEQPFLDGDFGMDDLSKKIFSNKLYLSRTINILSGKNFRQFINWYRINYAMDLMKKDPRIKLMEVAEMSGFHSAATFNMAFKLNTGMTPSEWMNEYLSAGKESLI